jgi:uncharacterized protein YdiU (UPF0061 family)
MQFRNSYLSLPGHFYARVHPTPVGDPKLVAWNASLAVELGVGPEPFTDAASIFSGNKVPNGAEPVALAYAGHQFGHFVPRLGDGRAILLGEVRDVHGCLRDVQLKGSGPTPFSRRGDGRSALGPALREFLVSEAMHAFGIPTTRSLAVVRTGEQVFREEPLPGGIVTRVAASHIRVGTFQYFAATGDCEAVEELGLFLMRRHYPESEKAERPFLSLLENIVQRQAALIAQWMSVGFIHGVMNTDNMALSGETIDYGPCAFMDFYDPNQVYSAIDRGGRYAFANQPAIAQWNLARFAETLLPLIDPELQKAIEMAGAVIQSFNAHFDKCWLSAMCAKIGILNPRAEDRGLVQELLDGMSEEGADFTLTFRFLCDAADDPAQEGRVRSLFAKPEFWEGWSPRWRQRLSGEARTAKDRAVAMRAVNPALIPRNHRVEQVLRAAVREENFEPFLALARALSDPFAVPGEATVDALPPRPEEEIANTFCGT